MRAVLFVDYGFIGENGFDINRGGTGMGIEWASPLGAIQLIFAKPINDKPGDRTSKFEFSMGRRF
jgi:outer membrane protein insertion porin family